MMNIRGLPVPFEWSGHNARFAATLPEYRAAQDNDLASASRDASRDRNAAGRLRAMSADDDDIAWEPYPAKAQVHSTSAILGRKKAWIACYGITLSVAGALIGAASATGSADTQTIMRYAAVGGGIGVATAALLTCGVVCEEKAKQTKQVRELGRDIDSLPYSKRALPGGKAILNAPSIDENLRSRLAALFDGIARTRANGKHIAELLLILHDDPASDATITLIERLATLMADREAGRIPSEADLMARIGRAIATWKSLKTRAVTAMVLYQGMRAGRIPAGAIQFEHAVLAQGSLPASAYLGLKNADFPPPRVDESQWLRALACLATCQRWKDHLENEVAGFRDQQAVVQHFVADALTELETLYRELPDQDFLTGIAYLKQGHNGDFLAQWYAEECLREPGFITSADNDWVKNKLIAEFNCPGLPENRILEIIDRLFAERKGRYVRENVPMSQSEAAQTTGQRQVNVSSMIVAADLEAQTACEGEADPSRQ